MGFNVYLNPKSMKHSSPKPLITAINASISNTFGVQVNLLACLLGIHKLQLRVLEFRNHGLPLGYVGATEKKKGSYYIIKGIMFG